MAHSRSQRRNDGDRQSAIDRRCEHQWRLKRSKKTRLATTTTSSTMVPTSYIMDPRGKFVRGLDFDTPSDRIADDRIADDRIAGKLRAPHGAI
jgi:hypothetical protein